MKVRRGILYLIPALLVISLLFILSAHAASSAALSKATIYGGEWVDQALVEVENLDGTLNLTINRQTGKASLEYSAWASMDTYNFYSAAPILIDEQQPVKFTYTYDDYNRQGELIHSQGEGIIQFKTDTIVLQMGALHSDIDPIFTKQRTYIRDPYASRISKPDAAFGVVSQYCNCKPSNLVTFDYPVSDNESNKNWIVYVNVYVRKVFLTEYKVNLHMGKATELKDSMSQAYRSYDNIKTSQVTASSTLPKSKITSYLPSQIIDGDTATCWCEGVKGSGVGQSFTIKFGKSLKISSLHILPGYGKSVTAYLENNSVRKAKIAFSDGTSFTADFTKDYGFDLPVDKVTASLKFTILEVVPGSKYNDTCVSELAVF